MAGLVAISDGIKSLSISHWAGRGSVDAATADADATAAATPRRLLGSFFPLPLLRRRPIPRGLTAPSLPPAVSLSGPLRSRV